MRDSESSQAWGIGRRLPLPQEMPSPVGGIEVYERVPNRREAAGQIPRELVGR